MAETGRTGTAETSGVSECSIAATGATGSGDSEGSAADEGPADAAAKTSCSCVNSTAGMDEDNSVGGRTVKGARSGAGGGGPAIKLPHLGRLACVHVSKSKANKVRRLRNTTGDFIS